MQYVRLASHREAQALLNKPIWEEVFNPKVDSQNGGQALRLLKPMRGSWVRASQIVVQLRDIRQTDKGVIWFVLTFTGCEYFSSSQSIMMPIALAVEEKVRLIRPR